MSFWQKLFGWGKGAAKVLGAALVNFIKSPAVKDLISTELGLIAQQIVGEFSTDAYSTLTNEEKRQRAFNSISATAGKAGISFTNSVINLLIEICVQNLKAK